MPVAAAAADHGAVLVAAALVRGRHGRHPARRRSVRLAADEDADAAVIHDSSVGGENVFACQDFNFARVIGIGSSDKQDRVESRHRQTGCTYFDYVTQRKN